MGTPLEKFYDDWYRKKTNNKMKHDRLSALRKSERIIKGFKKIKDDIKIETIIDFGCGYGAALVSLGNYFNIKKGYGFEYSEEAVDYAKKEYGSEKFHFYKLESLRISESINFIKSRLESIDKVDYILLLDILEHIPDCEQLIMQLSKITKYFIIKLPIESAIFDNYIIPKQYPGPKQGNGHLREFNVNDVHYFIRKLGLNPIFEEVYIYNIYDTVPPQESLSKVVLAKYSILRFFKLAMSYILSKKIFLRLIGGGGYWCIATYDQDYMLYP